MWSSFGKKLEREMGRKGNCRGCGGSEGLEESEFL